VCERASQIILFSILKGYRVCKGSEIVCTLMFGSIVERACEDASEISVAHNIGIHCSKWKTNILPTLIGTTACGTSFLSSII
jgi:hypothetical protein